MVEVEGDEVEDPCTSLELTPTAQTLTVTSIKNGPASGLLGEYFDNYDSGASQIPTSWTPTSTRIDPNIDFAMGSGSPGAPGIGSDNFSIRWTGKITPDASGSYKFATYTDDGARLWIDGVLIIDRWAFQAPTWVESSTFSLASGSTYDIRVEYFEAGGGAHAELNWSHPISGWQVIPTSAFTPPSGMAGGFQTNPSEIDFDAVLKADGCYTGTSVPLYSLDRFDSSVIDEDGVFRTFAPVAGEVNITSYIGDFTAGSSVSVLVDALETDSAPAGAETNHAKSPSGNDPATLLYPYANTVFPLGIEPPVLQYDNGGTSAASIKVSLRYPSSGTPVFQWSKIIPESNPPRFTIPVYAWKAFEQTAKGNEALMVLQRVIGSTPRQEITRSITFAEGPLRGKIYYTQYERSGSTKAMVADPGGALPAQDAFSGGSDGCPVCHSVSANGNVFVTSDRGWSSQGGFSDILDNGFLSPTTDHPGGSPYRDGSNDFRGFAWAPLTPDGRYALQANNIYGNTIQQVVGIDTGTDTVSVPDNLISGGSGTGLLAEFYRNNNWNGARWAQITPHVDYYYASGAGPGGPIDDDFTARFSGLLMPYFSEEYTFYLTSPDGVRLTVDGDVLINDLGYSGGSRTLSATLDVIAGEPVPIEVRWRDPSGDASLELEWSSDSTPRALIPVDQLYPDDGLHGVEASFYSNNNFTGLNHVSWEPNINHDWGSGAQPGLGNDNHSTEWRGQIEAPRSGNIRLCLRSDDDGVVRFDGVDVINQTGVVDTCSANINVVQGNLYDLFVSHREFGGSSYVELSWESGSWARTPVSSAYLRPPASFTPDTSGLIATYYDGDYWTSGQGTNPGDSAFTTHVDTPRFDWGSGRPNYSLLTNSDTFSGRYVGRIIFPCDGIYEFRSVADDASSLWIGQNRIQTRDSSGTSYGASYFAAGSYDFKYQFQHTSGNASAKLDWIPRCLGNTSYAPIPSANLTTIGGTASAGFVRAGGDNGNNTGYYVWETPSGSSDPPEDVTSDTDGRWGLGYTAMMVPSFAPNSSALVFVDGDSSGGAGWRKGLSVFDFDQAGKTFSNRRNIVNTWPYGHVIKWPVFESDSRTVMYSASSPVDWCCKGGWTKYGHMSPTNYFEAPGQLFTVDSQALDPEPVELKVLNEGERTADANKVYQPTVLPQASAGYRWVVFTSTRPYGNTFNTTTQNDYSDPNSFTPMVKNGVLQSTLWIAAIDDEASAASDRSHPAFLLPNQKYSENSSNGVLNERGFWALQPCRPVGTSLDSACEVDEDCCGGNADDQTAQCAIDLPVSSPPTRHCRSKPSISSCVPRGEACAGGDCCLNDVCVNAACTAPPPISKFLPLNFTRDFEIECEDTRISGIWRFFDWRGETPGDSYVEFYAQSADDPADFEELPLAPEPVDIPGVIGVGLMQGPTLSGWVGNNVGALLDDANLPHRQHLRITMRFYTPPGGGVSPSVSTWRQSYSCVPDH